MVNLRKTNILKCGTKPSKRQLFFFFFSDDTRVISSENKRGYWIPETEQDFFLKKEISRDLEIKTVIIKTRFNRIQSVVSLALHFWPPLCWRGTHYLIKQPSLVSVGDPKIKSFTVFSCMETCLLACKSMVSDLPLEQNKVGFLFFKKPFKYSPMLTVCLCVFLSPS